MGKWYNMQQTDMSNGKLMASAHPPRPLAELRDSPVAQRSGCSTSNARSLAQQGRKRSSGRYAGCKSAASEVFGCMPHENDVLTMLSGHPKYLIEMEVICQRSLMESRMRECYTLRLRNVTVALAGSTRGRAFSIGASYSTLHSIGFQCVKEHP